MLKLQYTANSRDLSSATQVQPLLDTNAAASVTVEAQRYSMLQVYCVLLKENRFIYDFIP